jgi:hypothetical protein
MLTRILRHKEIQAPKNPEILHSIMVNVEIRMSIKTVVNHRRVHLSLEEKFQGRDITSDIQNSI